MPIRPKYRALSTDELEELRDEFVQYLILNGITADDWLKLKEEKNEKAVDLVTLFSDVVFERIMRRVLFLEHMGRSEVRTFQCLKDKMILAGMHSTDPIHDFTDLKFVQKAAQDPPAGIEVFTSEKPYTKTRETELFAMTQAGCTISDGRLFKALMLSIC